MKPKMPQATVQAVRTRAAGRCERCGTRDSWHWSLHHRKPKGMGGSKDPAINSPANILLLCGSGTTGCHGWIESHRTQSYDLGLLVYRTQDPVQIPVHLHYGTVALRDDGGFQPC